MTLRRAISTLGCPDASLTDAQALVQAYGLDGLELRALWGNLDLASALQSHFGHPDAFAAELRRLGATVPMVDSSMKLVGGSEPQRAQLLALVPWAEAAGAPWLRVFDGGTTFDDAELRSAEETYAWWQRLRRENRWRVDFAIETHDGLLDVPRLDRFLRAFPAARILWDSHHTWRQGGHSAEEIWTLTRERVAHVHVKDSARSLQAPGYVHPGEGEFPMRSLLGLLERDGYNGFVSLEWERYWFPQLPPLAEALSSAAAQRWW